MDLNRARFIGSGQIIDEDGNVIDLGKIHSIEYSLDEGIVAMEELEPAPRKTKAAPAKKRPLSDALDAMAQRVPDGFARGIERMQENAAKAFGGSPDDYVVDNVRLDGFGKVTGDVRHKMMGQAPTAALPDIDVDFDKLKIWDPNDGTPDPLQNDTDLFVPGGGAMQYDQNKKIVFHGTTTSTSLPGNVTIDKDAIGYTGNLGGQVVSDFFSSDGKITAKDVEGLLKKSKLPLKNKQQPYMNWGELKEMIAAGNRLEDLYLLTGDEEWQGIDRAKTPHGYIDVRFSEHVSGTEVRVHDRWSR